MSAGDRTLDGNAIGGQLLELFGVDLTAAPCVCESCGAEEELARVDVYLDCPGTVVRCPHCGNVLLTIVRGRERTWVDLRGTRGLSL
jgi:Zn finger protein HypA/HybF involved in hydrogenase expression